MIKIENTEIVGWEAAIRGMRNPMNSWEKSDSCFGKDPCRCDYCDHLTWECYPKKFNIGPNDHDLMMRLAKGGSVHAKYRRMIAVYADITAPLYWWKEFDTYKVGTVANSTSTMHKLCSKPLTIEDFSMDCLTDISNDYPDQTIAETMVNLCENYRKEFLRTKSKRVWKALIQLLPESFNQTRTVTMNYENLFTIYNHRKNHKLTEWANDFIEWEKTLPYANELIFIEKEEN